MRSLICLVPLIFVKNSCMERISGSVFLMSDTTSSRIDRKSTRLNSSHVKISYAVFCSIRDLLYLPSFPTRRSSDLNNLSVAFVFTFVGWFKKVILESALGQNAVAHLFGTFDLREELLYGEDIRICIFDE